MSHGVTSATAALVYYGEAGGLDEATSDIFGTMVEFSAGNPVDPGDFVIGEKIRTSGVPLRWMDDPAKEGHSFSCWSRTVKRSDPHHASGVANHFFYLLSNGSGTSAYGTSPTCDGSVVAGIGRDDAARIWYRALTTYFTSSSGYSSARAGTLSAAADLYGSPGPQYDAVRAAWDAVNVTR